MTTKLKIIIALAILNIVIFEWLVPIWCLFKIILSVGQPDFYIIFINYMLYMLLSFVIEFINIPSQFLNDKDKEWIEQQLINIKNKNKES
jgi:hypothetical protein